MRNLQLEHEIIRQDLRLLLIFHYMRLQSPPQLYLYSQRKFSASIYTRPRRLLCADMPLEQTQISTIL